MYKYKYFINNTLPYKDIKTNIYKKVNNKTLLEVNSSYGIPCGTIARIILLFLTTSIINQKSKRVYIGRTFNEFMNNCGYTPSGGDNGNIERFKEQWKRILSSTFKIKDLEEVELSFRFVQSTNKFDGYIEVDQTFYNHLLKNKIYVDKEEIKKLQYGKYGSLALDLYFWLIYRRYTLKKLTNLKYEDLYNQFGSSASFFSFKTNLRKAFIVVATILKIDLIFKNDQLNIEGFSLLEKAKYLTNSLYLFSCKFQKEIKTLTLNSKYKLSIDFVGNTLILKP